MSLTDSDISALMARYGNERIKEQVDARAPLASGKLLDKKDISGQVAVVNIKEGFDNAGFVADQGTLFNGSGAAPSQGTQLPAYILGRVDIGRGAATLGSGKKDGINALFEAIDSCGASMARTADRSLFNPEAFQLDAAAVTALNAGTPAAGDSDTIVVADISPFRVGMVLELYDDSATAVVEYMKVTGIAYDATQAAHSITVTRGISTVTGTAAAMGVTTTTSDKLYILGGQANATVGLSQVCDASTSIHGHSAAGEWTGNQLDESGALTVNSMRDVCTLQAHRSGGMMDFVVSHSVNRQRYSDLLLSARRYTGGKMDGTGGVEIDFEGKPFKVDDNCPTTDIYFLRKEHAKIGVWKDFGDDADGGQKAPSSTGHPLVSSTNFSYDLQRWAALNLLVDKRNAQARLYGITS